MDDDLAVAAKRRAAERGITFTRLLQDALREALARAPATGSERVELLTFGVGGPRPGVDLDDSARLRDAMDGLR